MKALLSPIVTLSVVATTASAAELEFLNHEALYRHVALERGLEQTFQQRALPAATPVTRQLSVHGLARSWGRVQVTRDGIAFSGGHFRWSMPTQPFGRQSQITLDLELTQLWESIASGGSHALCLQSPMGSSGSAARWQHVIVIERKSASERSTVHAWTAPYASCQAIGMAADRSLVAGVFEFSFESEQFANQAQFVLHDLRRHAELTRYALVLRDPANLFSFTLAPATRRAAPTLP